MHLGRNGRACARTGHPPTLSTVEHNPRRRSRAARAGVAPWEHREAIWADRFRVHCPNPQNVAGQRRHRRWSTVQFVVTPPLLRNRMPTTCRSHANHTCRSHADTGCARFAHGLRTVCARFAHGLRTVCARVAHGLRTACGRFAHGLRTACARFAHGLRTVIPLHWLSQKHLLRQFCSRWRPNDPHGLIGRQKISPPKCIFGPTVVWE